MVKPELIHGPKPGHWQGRFAACLLGTLVAVPVAAGGPTKEPKAVPNQPAQPDDLLQRSSYVFRGTIKSLKATTVPIVPATNRTVIVHVDEVVHGADTIGDFTGSDVTVELKAPGTVQPGQRVVFYVNVKAIGKSVAFEEVGHIAAADGKASAEMRKKVDAEARAKADRALKARIDQADLIVTGTVVEAKPLPEAKRPPGSEHDPEWWQATVRIDSVEKGQVPGGAQTVTVAFPHSRDIRWFRSPKLDTIREGVFLLRRTEGLAARAKGERNAPPIAGYTALHALDVQPRAEGARIRALANPRP